MAFLIQQTSIDSKLLKKTLKSGIVLDNHILHFVIICQGRESWLLDCGISGHTHLYFFR